MIRLYIVSVSNYFSVVHAYKWRNNKNDLSNISYCVVTSQKVNSLYV